WILLRPLQPKHVIKTALRVTILRIGIAQLRGELEPLSDLGHVVIRMLLAWGVLKGANVVSGLHCAGKVSRSCPSGRRTLTCPAIAGSWIWSHLLVTSICHLVRAHGARVAYN